MDFVNLLFIILTSGLPCSLLALGIFITYRLLDFADLTAEGSFLIGGVVCITIIKNGGNPFLATVIAILAGGACGLITGLLHTKLKIPKLLSGIITMTATASIAMLIMGSTVETMFTNVVTLSYTQDTIYSLFFVGGVWNQVIEAGIMLIIVLVVLFLLYFFFGTEYGMAIRATGMNPQMSRAQGINTDLSTIFAVTLSNALIGLAGAMFCQDLRSVDVKTASGFLVIGLASIIIGETIFGKKTFKNWIISVSLGAIIYFIIVNFAIRVGFPTEMKNLLYAVLIVIALCMPFIKDYFKKLFAKKKEGGLESVNN